MRTWISIIFIAIILLVANTQAANIISVDSVISYTNTIGKVPINFTNDVSLSGVELAIWQNSPEVQIDSFSFIDGRVEYTALKGELLMGDTISIYAIPFGEEPLISPGTGLLGHLYLSYSVEITPQVLTIDTVTVLIPPDVEYATRFLEPSRTFFTPDFDKGYLDIQQGFGCCVGLRGNADNTVEQETNVADVVFLVDFLFRGGPAPDCPMEADVDNTDGPGSNVADIVYLVDFLFRGGPAPLPCTSEQL